MLKNLFLLLAVSAYVTPSHQTTAPIATKSTKKTFYRSGILQPQGLLPYGIGATAQEALPYKTKSFTAKSMFLTPQNISSPESSLYQYTVPVLQQDSSTPWKLRSTDLETNSQTIWDIPGLLWKDVRSQEGLNCAYHALKNISIILQEPPSVDIEKELKNPNSPLNQRLINKDTLIDCIGSWAPKIYEHRRSVITKQLQLTKQPYPYNFKEYRNLIRREDIRAYINSNDGSVKINHLHGSEVELLIKEEFSRQMLHDILIIEYDPELLELGGPELALGEKNIQRLQKFKKASHDRIGIIWTEMNFNHWVGYVAIKKNNQTSLYYLNSIDHIKPQYANILIELLHPYKI